MNDSMLLGLMGGMLPVPRGLWRGKLARDAQRLGKLLGFMSPEHHRVRNFVVLELPRAGGPLSPGHIAAKLELPLARVKEILGDLARHLFFLSRNEAGAVTWAYPVTVEQTPHRLTFAGGEQVYAAWAVDAMAAPFVQGRLRGEKVKVVVATECARTRRPLHLEIDSDLNYNVREAGARPMIFAPLKVVEPGAASIIDGFWRKSVFFWSEEQAREHRRLAGEVRGSYMTLSQAAYVTPLVQGAIFPLAQKG